MTRDVEVVLNGNDFQTLINNGQSEWILDEPPAKGGGDTGPTPTEAVLGALGACMAITGRMYAKHKNWDLQDIRIDLRIEGNDPGGSPVIYRKVLLQGNLDEDQTQRILNILTKCPVAKLLKGGVPLVIEGQI